MSGVCGSSLNGCVAVIIIFFFRLGMVWLAGRIKGFVNELFSLCFFAIAEVMIKVMMMGLI